MITILLLWIVFSLIDSSYESSRSRIDDEYYAELRRIDEEYYRAIEEIDREEDRKISERRHKELVNAISKNKGKKKTYRRSIEQDGVILSEEVEVEE